MTIKFSSAAASGGLGRAQIASLATVGFLGLGGSGVLVYKLASGPSSPAAAVSSDEAKLAARADERRAKAEADARKLRQQDLGQGYQFDAEGNLLGATTDTSELPQNRPFQPAKVPAPDPAPLAAIGRGIDRGGSDRSLDDADDYASTGRRRGTQKDDEEPAPAPANSGVPASMLGYSTVAGASWAVRRPGTSGRGLARSGDPKIAIAGSTETSHADAIDRLVHTMEKSTRVASEQAAAAGAAGSARAVAAPGIGPGMWGSAPMVSPGPSVAGENLYAAPAPAPAEQAPQPFASGAIGDMRIGGRVGPDQVVRQGKFLDCVLVNQLRADLVDSPVIAMVSRDYVSLDGKYVLIPAGAKLLGEAGRVQNLQQERVYIKFDRVVFPDQRSAYFPVRKPAAVDRAGAVGIDGDVDRHLMLQFGAAVMLGVLDGVGAAVQSPSAGTNPTLRDLVMARTSGDFSTVMTGAIQKYANVVPTVTVEAGAKMKVFFAEDVRLSPYMATSDLAWVRAQ
jgi:type IV secretory pathway VirB10-like protein